MHFTLWPSLTASTGGYGGVTWDQLRAFVASPVTSERKEAMEGWSPAKFREDRRGRAYVESISALVLDVDAGDHPLERIREVFAPFAGLVHSSWTHGHRKDGTPDPTVRRWRVVLDLARDATPAEHAAVWSHVRGLAAEAGIELDEATRDASRFWFVPGRRSSEAPYEWCELGGSPLDPTRYPASITTGEPVQSRLNAAPNGPPAAVALGRAWPASGRHEAQLALAGALRAEGLTAEAALDFLCVTCAAAGDENRPKREATVRHTYDRPADAPTTGWTRLAEYVPQIIVDAVRREVSGAGQFERLVERRLAEARAASATGSTGSRTSPEHVESVAGIIPINATLLQNNSIEVLNGERLEAPLPQLSYLVRDLGLVAGGGAPHLVAGYGFSGKTLALQAMLLALAAGLPAWGAFPVARPLRVLHVDLEQGDLTVRRYQRLARGCGVALRGLGDRLAVAVMPRIKLEAGEARWVDLMLGRDLVLVDSLRAARGGSENDSDFREALDMLGMVSNATGCRALVIHHAKKPGENDTEARYAIRGSSAIYDAVDGAYVFSGARGEPIRIEHVKARSHGDLELDRALTIQDVPGEGDPKWGLRVSEVATSALVAARATREKEDRLARASADAAVVRTVLVRSPGIGTRDLIDALKIEGVGKDRTLAAVASMGSELVKDEVTMGRYRMVRHWLSGGPLVHR